MIKSIVILTENSGTLGRLKHKRDGPRKVFFFLETLDSTIE